MRRFFIAVTFFILTCDFAAQGAQTESVWLSSLDLSVGRQGYGQPRADKSVDGRAISLKGKTYERGFGTHSVGSLAVELKGGTTKFTAMVGIDDETQGRGSVEFKVVADGGKVLWSSGTMTGADAPKAVDVNLARVQRVYLVVTDNGNGYEYDHADWADAKFEFTGERPKSIAADMPQLPPDPKLMRPVLDIEYDVLRRQIQNKEAINRFASTVQNPASLIADTDRDPADVVVRRTEALLNDLKRRDPQTNRAEQETTIARLADRAKSLSTDDANARLALYKEACALRRQIAFTNPLLNFDKLLFAKHTRCGPNEGLGNHMCDQYFGFKATPGGGVFVLENPFGPTSTVRDVLENATVQNGRLASQALSQRGSFISPSLSYDGKTIFFAYTENSGGEPWSTQRCYHVFKVNVDGTGLTQLTDGTWNEFDPMPMPNGKLVFISERRGGYGRCHGRPVPVYTLHTMTPEGSNITCISFHESNEWHPSINNEGMIVYCRWDYVDRGFNQAHHPWITTPDGRDARAIHGNYPSRIGSRPWMEMHVRAVPGSHKYVATAAPHHGQAYGSIVLVDPRIEDDDAMSPVKRITPDAGFPESEDNRSYPYGMVYGTAWPLSEDYHLVVYDPDSNLHGVYLVDSFGNRELIYRDPQYGCLNPIPLRSMPVPPLVPDIIPDKELAARDSGAVAVMNVYESLKPWPKDTKITALRIMQVLPKSTPYADNPHIGYGAQKSARAVLGTVPVEADGSAHFVLPARIPVYFQALDENGMAVQSMRSDTYVQPGERLNCAGCHQPTHRAPGKGPEMPIAVRRTPSEITPDVDGTRPFNYPRLVQGVLDRNCVACHQREKKGPDLSVGNVGEYGWTLSYRNLRPYTFFFDGAAETSSRTNPGEFGARASRLYRQLTNGHHNVKLTPEDMHRLTVWLDSNSDFYGAYENIEAQAKGEVVQPKVQ